ncbi:MAG TPA: hypothetical protein VKB88_12335 [Bryobacteraceae bacterium]|nr:hypothetical protein [Bryobacteraceae bacterium]
MTAGGQPVGYTLTSTCGADGAQSLVSDVPEPASVLPFLLILAAAGGPLRLRR